MPNKTLTVRLKFDTRQAESKLQKIADQISRNNRAIARAQNPITNTIDKVRGLNERLRESGTHVRRLSDGFNRSNTSANRLLTTVRRLASTYLGVMGARVMINTSDTITGSQNRLNQINGGDKALTQQQMDKMYVAANASRSSYADMMSNVSKSMTLASDAFNGNLDNAIKFQEIMAKSYVLGGASTAEASTSMYQMIQALGGGILAGDELRSVREGAPLAYKEIEKFAQKVYDSEDSLKDMASQGLITSDLVVAAIMDSGAKIEKQFENTAMTFGQAWNKIKTSAVKAFEPVSNSLSEMLNRANENGTFEKIERGFVIIGQVVLKVFGLIESGINWVASNWDWLKNVLVAGLSVIAAYFLVTKAIAIASAIKTAIAWIIVNFQMLLIIGTIALLIYGFYLFQQGAISACDLIAMALLAVAVIMFLIFGWQVALIFAILALVAWLFEYVCYGVAFVAAVIVDIVFIIWNIIAFVIQLICAIVLSAMAIVINLFVAGVNSLIQIVWMFVEPFISIVEFILNVCNGGFNSFGAGVANLIGNIISWFLSLGKIVTKIIDAIFGTNWTAGLTSLQDKVLSWGKNDQSITLSREAPELKRVDVTDAFSKGFGLDMYAPLVNPNDWGSTAMNWGSGLNFTKSSSGGFSIGDWLSDKLGLNLTDTAVNPNDPSNQLNTNPTPLEDLQKQLGNISDDTDEIADTVALSEEDLKYLRKIAEAEWKKEFTTAQINIDMTNNNSISGESDLDGLVTKLGDKLREELNVVANGVYV